MLNAQYFTVHSSQFTAISQPSFHSWKMANVKLLKIENCKLKIASEGGV